MSRRPPSPDVQTTSDRQQLEIDRLRGRLAEMEETLLAIRSGDVDAIVVQGLSGPQVYTLSNADRPYRTIIERMQEGAASLTPDGTILYANQRFAAFLGLALSHIVGQRFERFIVADDQSSFKRILANVGEVDDKGELSLRAADGTTVPVFLQATGLPEEGQRIVSCIITDLRWQKARIRELADANALLVAAIEDKGRAESMLHHAQKMEAVGQLTTGIAHDFNNLLSVISGNLELFHGRTDDAWLKSRLDAALGAVERGARLTGHLLAFSRRQHLRPSPCSINALLRDFEPLLHSSVGDEISLVFALGAEQALCLVDPDGLQATILNLVANAKDAMPDGGGLTISTMEAERDQTDDGLDRVADRRYLAIVITDTGHGMSPEIRERAFEPFFTTKAVGKGTGLGLSLVYGFMRQSGGHVTIDSVAGSGTSVQLYLPLTDAAVAAPKPEAVTPDRPSTPRTAKILVVEDDASVRELVLEVLEGFGYDTIAAENGPVALDLLNSGIVVDLVLSDIRMPDGISGFQLAREIRRRLPRLPIILTSGMTGNAGTADDAMSDFPILRKPYRCEDLSRAIEAALDAAAIA